LQAIGGDARNSIPATARRPAAELLAAFAEARRTHPAIREAFLISECTCRGEPFAVLSSNTEQAAIPRDRFGHQRAHRILRAYAAARAAGGSLKYYQSADDGSVVY